jgi:hypothetical protein
MKGQKTVFFLLIIFLFVMIGAVSPPAYAQCIATVEGPFGDASCGDWIDNDCDGLKDSADPDCYNYVGDPDTDDDGDGKTENQSDCNDGDAAIYTGATRICDGKDNNCDGRLDFSTDVDNDNDGYAKCFDCNDNDPAINPGATEGPFGDPSCSDGIDNDCNFFVDDCPASPCVDDDADGYYSPASNPICTFPLDDCDDSNPAINPGATDDNCDLIDDNCSGTPDDQYVAPPTNCGVGECGSTGLDQCVSGVIVDDCTPGTPGTEGPPGDLTCNDGLDNDCDALTDAAADPDCSTTCVDVDGDGYGIVDLPDCTNAGGDCDDSNANIHPGASDSNCNNIDENCTGGADEGYVPDAGCGVGDCLLNNTPSSCAGGVETACQPGTPAIEGPFGDPTCSGGADEDCDGLIDSVDDNCLSPCVDNDGDGYGNPGDASCTSGSAADDCDDTDDKVYPGATRICDGKDSNCDGRLDFASDVDPDGDGYPNCNECAPNNPNINPGVIEGPYGDPTCSDGLDNDCDWLVDEGEPACQSPCIDEDEDGYYSTASLPACTFPLDDCDDSNPAINPGALDDNCNDIDEDCSLVADDGYISTPTNCGVGVCSSTGVLNCLAGGILDNTCAAGSPTEVPEVTCSDAADNDCDGLTDAGDPDCAATCVDVDGDGYGVVDHIDCTNAGDDCDDSNAAINPGASDSNCNNIDENCAGGPDEGYVPDAGCGVGDCFTNNTPSTCISGVETACQPGTPAIEGPIGDPTCSGGADEDCDGLTDGADTNCQTSCVDNDGDGYGNPGDASCTSGSAADDCDDTDDKVYPGATRICDGKDNNCDGRLDFASDVDPDGDGYPSCIECPGGVNDPNINPGVIEGPYGDPTCSDGIDNDCDWLVDEGEPACSNPCLDIDEDGYGSNGHALCPNGPAVDCDDSNAAINPGAADAICDGVDDNCDGTNDDEYIPVPVTCSQGICEATGELECQGGGIVDTCVPLPAGIEGPPGDFTCSDLLDNDCDGLTDGADLNNCSTTCVDVDGDGYGVIDLPDCTFRGDDCDDSNAAINPGAADAICNGVDDNCDGTNDDEYVSIPTTCGVGECSSGGQLECSGVIYDTCVPLPAGIEGPPGNPTCSDGLDNDCDGLIDGADANCQLACVDIDGDGYGCPGDPSCPGGATPDCECNDPFVYPGAVRICDGKDSNCDGRLDFPSDVDNDGDSYPLCNDCNDNDPNVNPGATEGPLGDPTCSDGKDNDCDSWVDLGEQICLSPCIDEDGDGYYSTASLPACTLPLLDCDDQNGNIPRPDINCDGFDDNCSGTPDDEYVAPVTNCGLGICANTGLGECINGVIMDSCMPLPVAVQEGPSADPTCSDGLDNDCDGTVDDEIINPVNPDSDCIWCPVTGLPDDNCDGVDDDCLNGPDDLYVAPVTSCGFGECATTGLDECINGVVVDTCVPLPPGTEGPTGHPTCYDVLDNDCDSMSDGLDPDCAPGPCFDLDGDNYIVCNGVCDELGRACGDCDDTDPLVYPGATKICDGKDNNCDGRLDFSADVDNDNDGYAMCAECNDNDPNINPGIAEDWQNPPTCSDGLDNDCDGWFDSGETACQNPCKDNDGDGYYSIADSLPACTFPIDDCDDSDPTIYPGAPDAICNGIDNDCDSAIDEDYVSDDTCGIGICLTFNIPSSCSNGIETACQPGPAFQEGPGCGGDPTCFDGLDNDCDGITDFPNDPDCSGCCPTGTPDDNCDGIDDDCMNGPDDLYIAPVTNCGIGGCATTGLDECIAGVIVDTCVPLAPGIEGPPWDATCVDTLDNDCDGFTDVADFADCTQAPCPDFDGDTYALCDGVCDPLGRACGDCDDFDPLVYPDATRICDGKDNNCDGRLDFAADVDNDDDGYAACEECNDNDPAINPGASPEGPPGDPACFDGVDNDCNGLVDAQDCSCLDPCIDADGDGYYSMNAPCSTSCIFPQDDCNDSDSNVNPGASEGPFSDPTCYDLLDNDCSGDADAADPQCQAPVSCTLDSECQPAEYCAKAAGDCGGQGTCTQIPGLQCPAVYIPECGCDGQTYPTACDADNAGVNIDYSGECTACGGPALPEGPPGDPTCSDALDNDCDGTMDFNDPDCNGSYTLNITSGVAHTTGGFDGAGMGDVPVSGAFRLHISGTSAAMEDIAISDSPSMLDWNTLNGTLSGTTLSLFAPYTDPTFPFDTDFLGSFSGTSLSMTGNYTDPIVDGFNYDYDISAVVVRDDDADGYCNSADPACTDINVIDCDDSDPNTNPVASEGPPGDPTCFDTLDNDCDGLADGSDPDCYDPADAPHDIITDCTVCHDPGTYVAGATLDNDKCLACHDGATATLVETHHTPADLNCTDCHNVMRDQSPNIKHVKTSLAVFTANAAGTDFADGSGAKICETCHTTTAYYNNTGTGAPHETDVCTNCHTHDTGFGPPIIPPPGPHDVITDCTLCHDPGTYVIGATLDNNKCLACHDGATATLVETHHTPADLNCTDCHNVMRSQFPNLYSIKTTLAAFTANAAGTDFADNSGAKICETCHTTTAYYNNTGTGAPHDTGVCTTCHTHRAGFTYLCDLPDQPHDGNGCATDCTLCHDPGTYVAGATLDNAKCLACHDGVTATLAETHDTCPDLNCTDCHNVMRAQAGNAKHVKTSLAVFTGSGLGADYADNSGTKVCEACHTATAYYNNTGTGAPHDTGVCTTCHAHDIGFTLLYDPADIPHDVITNCAACHDGSGGCFSNDMVVNAQIPNVKCLACHDGSSATLVATHYSSNYIDPTTGQLVNIDCVECHNPMRAQTNLNHIRGIIRGIPVIFAAPAGANSFADGGAPYDGICEVCHTQTIHHQNDGIAPGGQSHQDGTDCTTCHSHEDGFVGIVECFGPHDFITDCAVCHDPGTYVPNPPIPDSRCQMCHDAAAPGAAGGGADTKVETHSGSTYGAFSINCVECHNDHCNSNNLKLVRSTIADSVVPGSQIVFTAYTGIGSFGDGPPHAENICDTCHTLTNHHRYDGVTGSHNDGTDCTVCHSHSSAYSPQ